MISSAQQLHSIVHVRLCRSACTQAMHGEDRFRTCLFRNTLMFPKVYAVKIVNWMLLNMWSYCTACNVYVSEGRDEDVIRNLQVKICLQGQFISNAEQG